MSGSTDLVETGYRRYALTITPNVVTVRTPDGRRLGQVRSVSGARRLIRAHRREQGLRG